MGPRDLPIESMTFATWWAVRAPQVLYRAYVKLRDEQAAANVLGSVRTGLSNVSADFHTEPECSAGKDPKDPAKWFLSLDRRWMPGGAYFWAAVAKRTATEGKRIGRDRRRRSPLDAAENDSARLRVTIDAIEAAEINETERFAVECLDEYLETLHEPERTFCDELYKHFMEQVEIVARHNDPLDPHYMQYRNALLTTGIIKGRARIYRIAIRTCVEKKLAR